MRQFIAFIKKEFIHIARDKRTMLILLIMPVVQTILFGFAISSEIRNIEVGVLDPSNDISTQRLIDRFGNSEYFTVVELLNSPSDIDLAFRRGEIDFAIVFGDHFNQDLLHTGESSIQFIADATDPNQARTITGYATSVVMDYQQELMHEHSAPFRINVEGRMLYNPHIKSAYNFVPGVMGLILMLICAMMTSISIVREKETGTMEVLLASPMKPIYIILAKAIPYLVLSAVNIANILLISALILEVPIVGSLTLLLAISLLFTLVALALGLMISSIVKTQIAAMLASGMGLMMPVIIFSGMIFPIESMPKILQWISNIIPARWYIVAVKKVMIEGLGIGSIINEVIILVVMMLLLTFVSLKNFKVRLE